jgi:3-methyl-2-oxobutanoate hydroxymethyltransferase
MSSEYSPAMSSTPIPDPVARPGAAGEPTKVTVPGLRARKLAGTKITALTAYDFPSASIVEAAGIDVVLVGDSLANTVLGYENTLPVSEDEMLVALRAVKRAVRRALLVADLPFGSFQLGEVAAVASAVRFVKAGAEAVKIEGGSHRAALVRRLVLNGIPVMGHIGLTPQSVHLMGGYKVQGRGEAAAERLLQDAMALEAAGAFAVVLEGMPASLAEAITARLEAPTIGIGAGGACDGQILVLADLLGLSASRPPKFVRRYLDLRGLAIAAVGRYRDDVLEGRFPTTHESYGEPLSERRLAQT